MIKKWLFNYVSLWELNINAKTFRKNRNKFDNLDIWQIYNKIVSRWRWKSILDENEFRRRNWTQCFKFYIFARVIFDDKSQISYICMILSFVKKFK